MLAKDRTQFVSAWQSHVQQLASLALSAGVQYGEWLAQRGRLYAWIDAAADQEFPGQRDVCPICERASCFHAQCQDNVCACYTCHDSGVYNSEPCPNCQG